MNLLHKGYDFDFIVATADDTQSLQNINARLFSLVTHNVCECTPTYDATKNEITFSINAQTTAQLPEGNYSLEIYDDSTLIFFQQKFCQVIPSAATETTAESEQRDTEMAE